MLTLGQSDATDYSSCDIVEGKLRIIFNEAQFGSWVSGALGDLPEALDKASAVSGPYSFLPRFSVSHEYEPEIEAVRKDVAEILGIPDVQLDPRLEDNAKVMTASDVRDWKANWGRTLLKIMKDAAEGLKNAGFKGDDMMQEAIQEALTEKKLTIHYDAEAAKGQWNAVALKDGVILLQVSAWSPFCELADNLHSSSRSTTTPRLLRTCRNSSICCRRNSCFPSPFGQGLPKCKMHQT